VKLNPERFASHLSVCVAVYNDKGELLLHQRGKNSKYLARFWDFPSGHVEEGEEIIVSAARELKEETGLTVGVNNLKLVAIVQRSVDYPYTDFLFVADKWQGTSQIMEPNKCDDMRWFPLDKLPDKLTSIVRIYQEKKFNDELTFHYIDRAKLEHLMGGEFDSENKTTRF
jgi:8-oxo-dGTP pyrophosphatase MutT (NUDIX family)